MDEIDIAESHGNSEALKDRLCHQRSLYQWKGGSLGAAWAELGEGGRKECWGFKSARSPSFKVTEAFREVAEEGMGYRKTRDAALSAASCLLAFVLDFFLG